MSKLLTVEHVRAEAERIRKIWDGDPEAARCEERHLFVRVLLETAEGGRAPSILREMAVVALTTRDEPGEPWSWIDALKLSPLKETLDYVLR